MEDYREGDLVKTRVPGFGTGPKSISGLIIDGPHGANQYQVLSASGKVYELYDWQIEKLK